MSLPGMTGAIAGSGAAVGVSDPYFSSVVGLWPFDEANGATSFTDYSSKGRTFTRTGTPTGSNSVAKFGSTSLNVPGDQWSFLTTDTSTDLSLAGDFTIDCWIYAISQSAGNMGFFSRSGADISAGGLQLERSTVGGGLIYFVPCTSAGFKSIAGPVMGFNAWHHYAADRSGSTVRFYYDGAVQGSQTFSDTMIGGTAEIGRGNNNTSDNQSWNGYLQDLRVTNGVARYAGTAFTPPTSFYPHS